MNARLQHVEPDPAALPEAAQWSLAEVVEHAQMLQDQGQLAEAEQAYSAWLHAHPQARMRHAVLFNQASLLQALGRMDEAQQALQSAIDVTPSFGQAYVNLGLLYEKLGQTDAALRTWSQFTGQRLLQGELDLEMHCAALNHIGRVQESRKCYDLAERALRESLRLKHQQSGVIQHWVHIRQKSCQWPVLEPLPGLSLGDLQRATSPLAMLALSEDPQEQLMTAQRFVHRTYPFKEERLHDPKRRPGARWRVGLVSADLREHAVGFLLPAFLQGRDTSRYELFAYDYTAPEQTALRRRLEGLFDHMRNISALSDRQAAELIAQDQIDILIDLHGLSSGARPGIFALHPAPHQATYLGYIGSTGMPWLEHVIVDPQVMPAELALQFTEKPLYLSSSFIPLTHEDPSPVPVSREEVGLPADAFVMAAFGNVYKITPEMFACWMRCLRRIEGAVLWLIDDNPVTTRNLRAAAQAQGVDPSRLVFAQRCEHTRFCAQLRLADVYLDTYPYNCGSTSNDVVNAGVPLVSLYGRTLVSRMGLSILTELGQADLAVPSLSAYEDKILEVALRTRAGHRYAYRRRSGLRPLMEALDKIRNGAADTLPAATLPPPARVQPLVWPASALDTAPAWLQEVQAHGAIARLLLDHPLDAHALYALDTPAWAEAGGSPQACLRRLADAAQGSDAVVMALDWQRHSLHRNPWTAMAAEHPRWLVVAQAVVQHLGSTLSLADHVWPAEKSLSHLTLAARKNVWLAWLAMVEKLQRWSADTGSTLGHALRQTYTVRGHSVTASQMIQSLLMNLVLADPRWQVRALDPCTLTTGPQDDAALGSAALQCNALKIAHLATGSESFKQAFDRLSAPLRQTQPPAVDAAQ